MTYSKSIGNVSINYNNFNKDEIQKNPMYMPDSNAAKLAGDMLKRKWLKWIPLVVLLNVL